jgi:uncharacterized protein
MIIQVSDIQRDGLTIADTAALAPALGDRPWRLEHVALRLDRDGADVVVTGEIGAVVIQTCSRCLEEFATQVRPVIDVRLEPRPATGADVELGADDLDVDFYDNDEVNLGRLIETETLLGLPMKPLCREECRGLCPTCGVNRNTAPCRCGERPRDPRLAALRDVAARLSH